MPKQIKAAQRVVRFHMSLHRAPGFIPHRGLFRCGGRTYPCILGRSGITVFKREGDGATPAGLLHIGKGLRRAERDRSPRGFGVFARLAPIGPHFGWCDDPSSFRYNRPVRLPFAASHEIMMRRDHLYDICLLTDWNIRPRRRAAGSAIFIHIARPGFQPTEGCIAFDRAILVRLIARMPPGKRICVVP